MYELFQPEYRGNNKIWQGRVSCAQREQTVCDAQLRQTLRWEHSGERKGEPRSSDKKQGTGEPKGDATGTKLKREGKGPFCPTHSAHLRNHAPPSFHKNKFRETGTKISYRTHFLTIQLTCKGRFEMGSNMKTILVVSYGT